MPNTAKTALKHLLLELEQKSQLELKNGHDHQIDLTIPAVAQLLDQRLQEYKEAFRKTVDTFSKQAKVVDRAPNDTNRAALNQDRTAYQSAEWEADAALAVKQFSAKHPKLEVASDAQIDKIFAHAPTDLQQFCGKVVKCLIVR